MNLIMDEQKLDRQQERAIYELTLKKQRSKKSTVSHKQVAAMQQLANELLAQRKTSLELLDLNHNLNQNHQSQKGNVNYQTKAAPNHISERYPSFKTTLCRCHSAAALVEPELNSSCVGERSDRARQAEEKEALNGEEEISSHDQTLTESNVDSPHRTSRGSAASGHQRHHHHQHYKTSKELQRQSSTSTIATTSTSTSSSSVSSASSASNSSSSASSLGARPHACQIVSNSSFISTSNSSTSMSDEANVKLIQLRLEQLNNELERRLHQYEYLVAQEKSILGTYNLNLFRNESVNNFHLFARANEHKNPL